MLLKDKLTEILNQTKGEREIHRFLKKEPWLVWATFMSAGGHSNYVIPEFSLAGKHRSDFVVMQSFSGGWNVAFIELEPVHLKPFDKDGNPSDRLRGAIKQIDDWKNFEYSEKASLCSHLADAASKYDILYPEHNLAREPWCVKMPLRDPRTYLSLKYFIVMGRRSDFDEELIHKKSKYARNHNFEILTYDRFIEVAENLEQQNNHYKSRTIEKKDKDFVEQFRKTPEKFSIHSNQDVQVNLNDLNVYGTSYNIKLNEREPGFVVEVLNTNYEIFEDRRSFNLHRIEPDGLALSVADNLKSLEAAIKLAEIFERLIQFHVSTEHSLDLVDECLQFLRNNLPHKIVESID
jgi:hypothetical protein